MMIIDVRLPSSKRKKLKNKVLLYIIKKYNVQECVGIKFIQKNEGECARAGIVLLNILQCHIEY
jgi:hypothetical protein